MSLETLLSFTFTLLVMSYLLADSFLYRLAIYVFVGVTSAFTAIVIVESIILPLLDGNPTNSFLFVAGLVVVGLLLLKPIPLLAPLGNLAFGFLLAVGTAVAVAGAITGTLFPLLFATAQPASGNILEAVIVLVGVVSALIYFQYSARLRPNGKIERSRWVQGLSVIGEGFVLITLGAIYGTAILSSLAVISGHFSQLLGG